MWEFTYLVTHHMSALNLWLILCFLLSSLCHRQAWALALCWCMSRLPWLPLTSQAPWLCSALPFGSWMNSEESQDNSRRISFLGLKLYFWELIRQHKNLDFLKDDLGIPGGFQIGQFLKNSLSAFEAVTWSRMSLSMVTLNDSLLDFTLNIRFNVEREMSSVSCFLIGYFSLLNVGKLLVLHAWSLSFWVLNSA